MSANGWAVALIAAGLAGAPLQAAAAQGAVQAPSTAGTATGAAPAAGVAQPAPAKAGDAFVPPIRRVLPKALASPSASPGKGKTVVKTPPPKRCATGKVWHPGGGRCVSRPLLKPSIPAKRKVRR